MQVTKVKCLSLSKISIVERHTQLCTCSYLIMDYKFFLPTYVAFQQDVKLPNPTSLLAQSKGSLC